MVACCYDADIEVVFDAQNSTNPVVFEHVDNVRIIDKPEIHLVNFSVQQIPPRPLSIDEWNSVV